MAVSEKTKITVWGSAAGLCSFPDCRTPCIDSSGLVPISIGEVCHIVAQSFGGPRGNSPLSLEERDQFSNLILLCPIHHRIIDENTTQFTIPILQSIKSDHESWVRQTHSGFDEGKQIDNEIYAEYLDEWADLISLDNWTDWSSAILSHDQPHMGSTHDASLEHLRTYLLSRYWPGRYQGLEKAFKNFWIVLKDFHELFREHAEPEGPEGQVLRTKKFYRINRWDPEEYKRLSKMYNVHVGLVQNLMVELTRSANYLIKEVRNTIDPSYRIKEGWCVTEYGPTSDLTWVRQTHLYLDEEIINGLYPGFQLFKDQYKNRSFYFPLEPEDA